MMNSQIVKEEPEFKNFKNIHKSIFSMKRQYSQVHKSEWFNCMTSPPEAYKCGNCDFQTFLMLNLDKHIKVAHKVLDSPMNVEQINIELLGLFLKSFLCTHCCFETYSELLWYKHITEGCLKRKKYIEDKARLNHQKFYECDQCKYKGKEKSYLKTHKLTVHATDENAKWYYCEQCPHKTKYRNSLRSHIQAKHRDIFPYKCDYCALKTKQKANLMRHIERMHKKMNWFECDKCDFSAKWKHLIIKHMKEKHSNPENKNNSRCGVSILSPSFKLRPTR